MSSPAQNCALCLFYKAPHPMLPLEGTCHRYPQSIRVDEDYWCGEFKPKSQPNTGEKNGNA